MNTGLYRMDRFNGKVEKVKRTNRVQSAKDLQPMMVMGRRATNTSGRRPNERRRQLGKRAVARPRRSAGPGKKSAERKRKSVPRRRMRDRTKKPSERGCEELRNHLMLGMHKRQDQRQTNSPTEQMKLSLNLRRAPLRSMLARSTRVKLKRKQRKWTDWPLSMAGP